MEKFEDSQMFFQRAADLQKEVGGGRERGWDGMGVGCEHVFKVVDVKAVVGV